MIELKDYSGAISDAGFILKEDENNLEALLLRGRGYYYLADHDVAIRFVNLIYNNKSHIAPYNRVNDVFYYYKCSFLSLSLLFCLKLVSFFIMLIFIYLKVYSLFYKRNWLLQVMFHFISFSFIFFSMKHIHIV